MDNICMFIVNQIACEVNLERARDTKKRTATFGLLGFKWFAREIKKDLTQGLGITKKITRRLNENK